MAENYINKKSILFYLPLAGLILLYGLTRLTGLTVLPISNDEATWIHWAQIFHNDPAEVMISTSRFRPPLFVWLNAITLGAVSDPLAAGRWVSVLAGLASMIGLFFIGRDLFNRTVGFLAGLLYIVVPYTFFFDRLAIPAALLTALGIWMLRWSLHIARETRPRNRAFKILGGLIGAAFLVKTSAWMLLPIVVLIFIFWEVYQKPQFWKKIGIAAGISLAINLPVLLSILPGDPGDFYQYMFHKDEWIPLTLALGEYGSFMWNGLMAVREFYVTYLTAPVLLVLTASFVYLFRERLRIERVLWIWLLIPPLIFTLLGGVLIGPQQYLIAIPPVLLLVAVACDRLAHFILITLRKLFGRPHHAHIVERSVALAGFMTLVLFSGAMFDKALMGDPFTAPLYQSERDFYLELKVSGTGVREAAQFIKKEAEAFRKTAGHALPLILPMQPGNPAEGVTVYLWNHPDVRLVPAHWWPKDERLIPGDNRFSQRPSIYRTAPVLRRESRLLDYAHFILTEDLYSRDKFLKENPRFAEAWRFQNPTSDASIIIYKNHPIKVNPEAE